MEQNMVLKLMRVREGAIIPKQATAGSAGYDLRACIEQRLNADFRHVLLHSLILCLRSSPTTAAFSGWPLAAWVAQACVI